MPVVSLAHAASLDLQGAYAAMNLWDHPNDYPSHALPPPTRERSRRVLGCAVEDRRHHLVQTLRDRRRGLVRVLDALQVLD